MAAWASHHMPDVSGTIEGLLQGSEAPCPRLLHDEQCKRSQQISRALLDLLVAGLIPSAAAIESEMSLTSSSRLQTTCIYLQACPVPLRQHTCRTSFACHKSGQSVAPRNNVFPCVWSSNGVQGDSGRLGEGSLRSLTCSYTAQPCRPHPTPPTPPGRHGIVCTHS